MLFNTALPYGGAVLRGHAGRSPERGGEGQGVRAAPRGGVQAASGIPVGTPTGGVPTGMMDVGLLAPRPRQGLSPLHPCSSLTGPASHATAAATPPLSPLRQVRLERLPPVALTRSGLLLRHTVQSRLQGKGFFLPFAFDGA